MMLRHNIDPAVNIIRRIVDETQEAIDAAVENPGRDRALADALRDGSLSKSLSAAGAMNGVELARAETIRTSIELSHAINRRLISERETLGNALERIGRALDDEGAALRLVPGSNIDRPDPRD